MTPEQFDAALTELEWKGSDFCARAGLVPNTVWRWRKALAPIPPWVSEYLRAVLAVQRLHAEFVAVRRPVRQTPEDAGRTGAVRAGPVSEVAGSVAVGEPAGE